MVAGFYGVKLLNKDETVSILKTSVINFHSGNSVELLPVVYSGGTVKCFEKREVVKTSSSAVYCLPGKELKIFPYGGLQVGSQVLNLDFGSSEFLRCCFTTVKRRKLDSHNCIVLWSHNWGGGYYDYLFFVYAKLLRIKDVIGEKEYRRSIVLYPLFGKSFEKELWRMAGLEESQVLDVRTNTVEAMNFYIANNENWFFPNIRDIENLRRLVLPQSIERSSEFERIYISRKNKRKLSNEDEIIQVLQEFGFKIIEDEARTVKEQMEIYYSADFIMGPHGASFSNILWSRPETVLIELFSNRYYPPYYRYLANVLGLKYYAIMENDVRVSDEAYSSKNLIISPEIIRNSLRKIFSDQNVLILSAS